MITPARVPLAHLPTPVDELPRLAAELGGPRLSVKRDDQTGLAFGGNKTRKLELLLAGARSAGARTLLTVGAVQSNHCRQTAAAAARAGFGCVLVLEGEEPAAPSGNVLIDRWLGAELVWARPGTGDEELERTRARLEAEGRRPHVIPYGGSNGAGAAAYVLALRELLDQLHASARPAPQWIVVAASSGGTLAGLELGARLARYRGTILGISVGPPAAELAGRVANLAGAAAQHLGVKDRIAPGEVRVTDEFVGQGYARPGEPEREALRVFARTEGLLLDPVYTARAAAGLLALVRRETFSPRESVLFWHTGGLPALFADGFRALVP